MSPFKIAWYRWIARHTICVLRATNDPPLALEVGERLTHALNHRGELYQ